MCALNGRAALKARICPSVLPCFTPLSNEDITATDSYKSRVILRFSIYACALGIYEGGQINI